MSTNLVPPVAGAIPMFDFSSWNEDDQHQIDWPTFAAWVLPDFPQAIVVVKMGQGDGWYLNPYRHRQRWGAHAAGFLNVFLYWYVEVICGGGTNKGKTLSGADNADALIKAIGDDGSIVQGEGIAGDWEDNALPTADLGAMALDFGTRVGRPLSVNPMLYSAEWFANPHGLERDKDLAQFPLWWASYQTTMPPVPEPWASAGKGIAAWQFRTDAILPGVPYQTDVSWWLAGLPALRAIQWPQPDPLKGKSASGTPDLDKNTDVREVVKHVIAKLEQSPPDVPTAIADLAQWVDTLGLVGS